MIQDRRARYDIRKDPQGGWEVFDVGTTYTVVLDGAKQTGLGIREADDLAGDLDRIATLVAGPEPSATLQ